MQTDFIHNSMWTCLRACVQKNCCQVKYESPKDRQLSFRWLIEQPLQTNLYEESYMVNIKLKEEQVTLLEEEIKTGDQAPDFTVLSNDLKEVSLNNYKGKVKLISTVPSLDTGVCSQETKRF